MSTIFSKIIDGEIPCYKVAENDDFLAFLDINPNSIGHTLCIPKREVDDILDLSVGFTNIASIGTKLDKDRPLAVIHAATKSDAELAANNLKHAYTISDSRSSKQSAINGILTV